MSNKQGMQSGEDRRRDKGARGRTMLTSPLVVAIACEKKVVYMWRKKRKCIPLVDLTIRTDSYDQPDDRLPGRDPRRIHTTIHATIGPPVSLLGLCEAAVQGRVAASAGAGSRVVCPRAEEEVRADKAAERRRVYPRKSVCARASCCIRPVHAHPQRARASSGWWWTVTSSTRWAAGSWMLA